VQDIRYGFVTCVQLGLSCMEAIYADGFRLELAITLEDTQARSKSGRIYLDEICRKHGTSLLKTRHINSESVAAAIRQHRIDWLFIIGWSQIAGSGILQAPSRGVLGIHPTLLPVGRGRAAIPWAILKRLPETGVTMFKLDEGVDTGPIVAQRRILVPTDADASWLYAKVNLAHIDLIRDVVPQLSADALIPTQQDEAQATIWPGRKPEDGLIDLQGSVHDAALLVRAVTRPYPGAFIVIDGRKIIVWKAEITDSPTHGSFSLRFRDGYLHCLDYEPSPLRSARD
jgi:methionyl-tRNA formyltransferase